MSNASSRNSPYILVGERQIGEGADCFVIAEAGVNHNGSLNMALELVDAAVDAGADAVKFQKRHLPSLYPEKLLLDPNQGEWAFHYLLPFLRDSELENKDFFKIKEYCDKKGILFMCTPWDEVSLDLLEQLNVEAYKISSADLVNLPLIDKITLTGKPMILSTGMATWHEIEITANHLKERNVEFALLHCLSAYPAPFEALNLRFIKRLKEFGVPVGYSGHERGISVPIIALTLGASIVEKHITLDRTLAGPDHAASLEPHGFKKMVRDIRIAEKALGSPNKPLSQMELLNRHLLRKSLVAARDMEPGEIVEEDAIEVRGPGKGISPQRIQELLGVRLVRSVSKGAYFVEGDLGGQQRLEIKKGLLKRQWGLKARFHDLEEVLALQPRMVELHFTDKDLEHKFRQPQEPYPQRLIIHAPEFFDGRLLDLAAESAEIRSQSIELLQRTIDKAVLLTDHFSGPVGLVTHVGGMSMDAPIRDTDVLLERAVDAFHQLDPKGIMLLPENLPPRPWYFGGQWFQNIFTRPEEMVTFCQSLDLGMTLDLSHAQLHCTVAGTKLSDFVRCCMPVVAHLHIADATGIDGEGIQIGEGVIDWVEILEILREWDFSWVPEIWSGHLNRMAGFIEALNRISGFGGL